MIIVSFCVFDRENYVTLAASLIGVTSLIFNAKGNPFGRLLMILFSLLYGLISLSFAYYGEMIDIPRHVDAHVRVCAHHMAEESLSRQSGGGRGQYR